MVLWTAILGRFFQEFKTNVINKLKDLWFFNYRIVFIFGLIIAHSLVEYAFVAIFINYLTDSWTIPNLLKATIITSVQEGFSSILKIHIVHLSASFLGTFLTIAVSIVCYVASLLLLWILDPYDDIGVFMMALVLLTIGTSGCSVLEFALEYTLSEMDQSTDSDHGRKQERIETRKKFWWRVARLTGATISIFLLAQPTWEATFKVTSIIMASTSVIFLLGYRVYCHNKLGESPLEIFYRVIAAAARERHHDYSEDYDDYYIENHTHPPLFEQKTSHLRFLEKAALRRVRSSQNEADEEQTIIKSRYCTLEKVDAVMRLLRMFPMWLAFGAYCLVSATGKTFFFQQNSNLDEKIYIGFHYTIPIITFNLMQKFSGYAISQLYDILPNRISENVKLKIGVGMVFSCLTCVAARQFEVHRLERLKSLVDETGSTGLSIFWLAPQFCLLGFMEGLAEDGLVKFYESRVGHMQGLTEDGRIESYESRVHDMMKHYGPLYVELVMGVGKWASILYMLIFKVWVGDTPNHSSLDNYYGMLAMACIGNFVFYGFVTNYYAKKEKCEQYVEKERNPGELG